MSEQGPRIGVRLPGRVESPGEYLADAAAFEAAGVDSLWVDEGLFRFAGDDGMGTGHEPWTRLAAIAAVTHRARLGTAVSVAAMWPPALLAAAITSLDHLSRGRALVGVGAGWEPAPLEATGVPFEGRGRRLEELIAVLRHLWSEPGRPFAGDVYRLPALRMAEPFRPGGPPILVGASGGPGRRRAARVADGFIDTGRDPEQLGARFRRLRELRAAAHGDDPPFELWVLAGAPRGREEWRATLEAGAAAGATGVIVPATAPLLDILRNPEGDDDRRDLSLAQG